ncbi:MULTISPECIES: phosphate signaling complex protein PhoU [Sphingosinicellaceae]|uniref:phosphate signaling complex protein PhoU n=1 Tax=Sphingosinicellaceae TaxID=2820280 RepID=UPI001C1DE9DA|nr:MULTISPECIES: phosphate signaling complex protein PhoU [Polymorphobacter]QYE34348.1 phosphate signaling complex protein PhoU [Polymorphobacter sp. PAMC 29334]UAJ09528.1 phosphate signaling complex protein PhoU [Polymorphobacter megasporae]
MADQSAHTVKSFDDEINQLRSIVGQMGGLCEAQITAAVEALMARDPDAAIAVVETDKRIDALEAEAERLAVTMIALRAPMASDLREIIAALKISSVLERIGDYAKNIAKRASTLTATSQIEPVIIIPQMARVVVEMIKDALDAFVDRDADKALAVVQRDATVDDFYNSLFRSLLTFMMENPHHITPSAHLLFIAKNLERIGDHATNVAEMVYFSATGDYIADRKKTDDTAYAV